MLFLFGLRQGCFCFGAYYEAFAVTEGGGVWAEEFQHFFQGFPEFFNDGFVHFFFLSGFPPSRDDFYSCFGTD